MFQCTSAGGEWRCDPIASPSEVAGLFPQESVDRLVAGLTESAGDYDFAVESRQLTGVEARCLVTTRRPDAPDDPAMGASATLCLSPEGARLLTEVPTGTLRVVEYSTDVPDDAFDLPAEPA